MPAYHLLYGLRVSSNLPIPGLAVAQGTGSVALHIRLKDDSDFASKFSSLSDIFYTSPKSNPDGEANLQAGMLNHGAYYGFFYNDGPKFAIDLQGLEIWGDWPDGYSLEDACTYLIGQIFNFAIRLRGGTSLHASSIAVGDRAIAIAGAPGRENQRPPPPLRNSAIRSLRMTSPCWMTAPATFWYNRAIRE